MPGFSGHFLTKSGTYSTTLGALRADRAQHQREHAIATGLLPASEDDTTLVLNHCTTLVLNHCNTLVLNHCNSPVPGLREDGAVGEPGSGLAGNEAKHQGEIAGQEPVTGPCGVALCARLPC